MKSNLLPVYAAHESDAEGGETSDLAESFEGHCPVQLSMSLDSVRMLAETVGESPTQLAFVGAGDVEEFAAVFASWIRADEALDAACLDYLRPRLSPGCALKSGEPLANKTTIRIGGAARPLCRTCESE